MDGKPAVGKRFEGHTGIARESQWLTSDDLQARGNNELTVKIQEVQLFRDVKFEGGRSKDVAIGLKFEKLSRVLLLNATNRKALNAMFGKVAKAWFGQTITLYVTQTRLAGETVDCLRIRNKASRAATPGEDFLHGEDDEPRASMPAGEADRDTFDQACDVLGVPLDERLALLTKHRGDRAAAERELSARANEGAA